MIEYAPGMRVEIRGEEWMIRKVEKNTMGNKALYCIGISPLIKDREAVFLSDLDSPIPIDPAQVKLVADDSPKYIKSKLFIESQWRKKIPTDNELHIGYKAAMDTLPYQLEPAHIALARPRQRILIADSVGLGKTLEAGILMSELIARGKGKRILVVTAKSMMTQFQKEMWNRFTIPLVRLDSSRIQKIRQELPSNYNPFYYYDKTIVSVDTIKRDIEYRTHLENAYWDIIVIDEAQNVAERGDRQAQRARLAKLLSKRSDTLIMLSATPHDGRAESFASLMNMLDRTAIANPKEYTSDDIKGLYVRRFKKDVKDQLGGTLYERNIEIQQCDASDKEEAAYIIFADMKLKMDDGIPKGSGKLFKTSLEKAMFSSPAACIKTIEERLKKLAQRYPDGKFEDIGTLNYFKEALEKINVEDFSKYQELLSLLTSSSYGWNVRASDDRVVIFTERIETMKYLAENLRRDLNLRDDVVQEIYGGMSDEDQQRIVENFGRTEAPIRILVASDVASEGLNLHYLSHRLIHFDIPWSLMVFQQRNGRIDRYGQEKQPDIRYMFINSDNDEIKGDMRVFEILIEKESEAMKNIGDPAMIMGKYSIEDEELVVRQIVEQVDATTEFSFDFDSPGGIDFDLLFQDDTQDASPSIQQINDETLLSDKEYLERAYPYINKEVNQTLVSSLTHESGLELIIKDTEDRDLDLGKRLKAILPEEVRPQTNYIRLSDNKDFIMREMKRSMQFNMDERAWPTVQYMWSLHPVFNWLNDKCSLMFGRGEAPVIISDALEEGEVIFMISGSIPNRKSTALVDEWFGVRFKHGNFIDVLPMEQLVNKCRLRNMNASNPNTVDENTLEEIALFREDAVKEAKAYLGECFDKYSSKMEPLITQEIDKLAELEKRHLDYQQSLFEDSERKRTKAEREVEELFDGFVTWVKDTLTIENNPYIRIISVVMGA